MRKKRNSAPILAIVIVILLIILIIGIAVYLKDRKPETPIVTDDSTVSTVEEIKNSHTIEGVKNIYQKEKWPNGCESVSTVMALKYAGVDISVDEFIDKYLNMTGMPFDPNLSYGGNPRDGSGFGCYSPVIKAALDKALENSSHTAVVPENMSLEELCETYISNDIPVILWATQDMAAPFEGKKWEFEGKEITWIRPEHCLLLVGFNENEYIFCDPLKTENTVSYPKNDVETAYKGLFSQAVVIK